MVAGPDVPHCALDRMPHSSHHLQSHLPELRPDGRFTIPGSQACYFPPYSRSPSPDSAPLRASNDRNMPGRRESFSTTTAVRNRDDAMNGIEVETIVHQ